MPGLKNGHKAHWCVISGCLAQAANVSYQISSTFHPDSQLDGLWHMRPMSRGGNSICDIGSRHYGKNYETNTSTPTSSSQNTTPIVDDLLQDDLTIIALWRHGKSRNLAASPLQELCESNDQLTTYHLESDTERDYIIKSVRDGLAGQVVVLHKTKSALSDLIGAIKK